MPIYILDLYTLGASMAVGFVIGIDDFDDFPWASRAVVALIIGFAWPLVVLHWLAVTSARRWRKKRPEVNDGAR